MNERFAVVFRVGRRQAAGALEVEHDRLSLRGRGELGVLGLEIQFHDLSEVRRGFRASERLNGYPTLVLERTDGPPIQVAPLGVALLPEIVDLLAALTHRDNSEVLEVAVPLKPGCLAHARKLLGKGPPIDPASLGLSGHEVYLREGEAVFVFRGGGARAAVSKAIGHPAVWRAGLAWQRCFAAAPRIVETAQLSVDAPPAYRWVPPEQEAPW
jgi:hypothetical protein